MSFNTSLSGLNAAQADLGVISHDIANVATVGYKESRAEFGDIFATSALGGGSAAIGSGVLLTNTAQQFHQGNLNFTSNSLDLAVAGEGFFVTSPGAESSDFAYTRAGQFGVDAQGYVVNSTGGTLRGFQTNSDGTVTSTSLDTTIPLQIPSSTGSAQATSLVELGVNLTSDDGVLPPIDRGVTGFNANDNSTYSYATSVKVYDSLGESHIQSLYFTKTTLQSTWEVRMQVDGADVGFDDGTGIGSTVDSVSMVFDAQGKLSAINPSNPNNNFVSEPLGAAGAGVLANGADPSQTLTLDFGGFGSSARTTQLSESPAVLSLDQDGFPPGQLSGIEIDDTGVIRANFSNGQAESIGKVALARFQNQQGLTQLGNTSWRESIDSGTVLAGEANTSGFGLIRSGATEGSNVDLTKELVNLITAQRNFQANSKGIEANNAITNTILQIR